MRKTGGFLLGEETLKIVVAVIAIGFLVYFLVALYFSAKTSQEMEQAESTLNFLIGQTAAGMETTEVYNPDEWWILSNNGELCICADDEFSVCGEQNKGVCQTSELIFDGPIEIKNPPITLKLNKEAKTLTKTS
mgnify:CR=1 FL=1